MEHLLNIQAHWFCAATCGRDISRPSKKLVQPVYLWGLVDHRLNMKVYDSTQICHRVMCILRCDQQFRNQTAEYKNVKSTSNPSHSHNLQQAQQITYDSQLCSTIDSSKFRARRAFCLPTELALTSVTTSRWSDCNSIEVTLMPSVCTLAYICTVHETYEKDEHWTDSSVSMWRFLRFVSFSSYKLSTFQYISLIYCGWSNYMPHWWTNSLSPHAKTITSEFGTSRMWH